MQTNYSKIFLIFMSFSLLTACSEHYEIEKNLDKYTKRLESFTKIDASTLASNKPNSSITAPPKRKLLIPLEPTLIKLREFYSFKECPLYALVAERNTALGKTQLPSSRFIYEKKLLNALNECIEIEENKPRNDAFVAKLKTWRTLKATQIHNVWANMFTQSNEVYFHFTQAPDYISAASSDEFTGVKQALNFLINAKTVDIIDEVKLERHLQQLEQSRLIARMWRTQDLLIDELTHIAPLLEEYLVINTCSNKQQKQEIDIMKNIFTIFFAQNIQSQASELNKYYYQLKPLYESIIGDGHLPLEFIDYVRVNGIDKHQEYRDVMAQHIKLWQMIFATCS